jgi:hypothetical protein
VANNSIVYSGSGDKQRIFSQSVHDGGENPQNMTSSLMQGLIDTTVEWFMLGDCDDAVLSVGSTFGATAWARTLKHLPIQVDNFDLSCTRRSVGGRVGGRLAREGNGFWEEL